MKQIFKKISAIAASVLMTGMTMGIAAAANYPSPFVAGGAADVAIVYGTGAGVSSLDLVQASNIQADLSSRLGTGTGGTGTVTGGDSFLIAKSSDNLNINNSWGVFSGTVTEDDLKTLLADGTYVAEDNDEFDYEQKITLGTPELKHFRDSDYETLAGLTAKTPVVGFRLTSNTFVLNYTLDFTSDVISDVTTGLRMEDIEGSDLPLMGRTYYVSELNNGTSTTAFGKMILLDAATVGNVREGETATVAGHQVSIDWIDNNEVVFLIDGVRSPASGKLEKGNSYKLDDGSYIGVRDISKLEVSGEVGSASFSIGTGKLEFPSHGTDIKMNDDTITGMKGYVYKSSGDKLDKIVIEWRTDDESFLTPAKELEMPGFGALKFSMNNLIRTTEEKITIEKDGDTSIEVNLPIKRSEVSFNMLWLDTVGDIAGVGKSATERLLSSNQSTIRFYERYGGNDYHKYFFATYNVSKEGESYMLRAQVSQDLTALRNETTIQSYENGAWTDVCEEKALGDTCNIGDVSLTVKAVNYTSGGNESVDLEGGTDVNFHTVLTTGGLMVYLPYVNFTSDKGTLLSTEALNGGPAPGALDVLNGSGVIGHNGSSFYLVISSEDKDETLGAGKGFGFTISDTSEYKAQVTAVNTTGGNAAGGGTGGADGLEIGETSTYETYVKTDTAPRILHYTQPDEDWAEVYYPNGDSETYGEVYLTESGAVLVPGTGTGQLGEVLVKDTEVSTVSSKHLIVVGGSCINSVAANLIGGAYCGNAWTEKTGVGSGEFLIKSYAGKYTAGKIALLVAGYEAADTTAAATALKNKVVDTAKEYKGTTSTTTVTEVTAA